ncbi:hypothetical protein DPMN_099199 [Dreissena polymorpha]|uniref:C-type lectin domain-containing protein n=1 Tax=Dreissena polymorpha TaxID=45954 RepID=A0A9D4R7F3_DREPO|nr:hypothetical protein DPMN_099175 [Dreissena polymorpha]KAH3856607.1 hypothetical protein DPMN_099199 [Dreissena polymorpha]
MQWTFFKSETILSSLGMYHLPGQVLKQDYRSADPKDRMSDKKALNFTNWDTTSGTGTSEVGARNCVYMSESLDYKWVPASCIETINFLCYHAG